MATEVSSLSRMLGECKEEGEEKRELVTRNLLGGTAAEVDLELQVPAGWERPLDLSSGNTYLQKLEPNPAPRPLHDLNLPPPSPSLGQIPAMPLTSAEYGSVCTLEKVKSALERESRLLAKPLFPRHDGSFSPPSSSSSSVTTSTSSSSFTVQRRAAADQDEGGAATSQAVMAVAVCPACLLYVLVSRVDPRCPRCAVHVPVNELKKRARIDLNFSLQISGSDLC